MKEVSKATYNKNFLKGLKRMQEALKKEREFNSTEKDSDTDYNFSPRQINELDELFDNSSTVNCSLDNNGSMDY